MTGSDRIGIDIEQFMRDPYGTGIQRVLQYLAIQWPTDLAADFLVPAGDGLLRRLTPQQAAELISVPAAESMEGARDLALRLQAEGRGKVLNQFGNSDNPLAHYRVLARTHSAPRLRPPFNDEARRAAGFSQAEMDYLLGA